MSEKKDTSMIRQWVSRLLGNKIALSALLFVGILLMLLPVFGGGGEAEKPLVSVSSEAKESDGDNALMAEGRSLASQAQKALAEIQGAGRVQLTLTLERSSGGATGDKGGGQLDGAVIRGVLITAEGAGDPQVKLTLYEAASALFGIPENQIFVAERKGE